MSKRIQVTKYGTIHYIAQCTECDWSDGIEGHNSDRCQVVRNKVYSHVRATGHRVQVEGGTSTDYQLSN